MLKLPKGLKKKKKGKKSKKDQELFTEAELEQYKRDHQAHPEQQAEQHPEKSSENDDEWSRFAALTTGVDSILKKTQDDLDRIKTTSFFKRVAPPAVQPKVEEKVEEVPEEVVEEPKAEKDVAKELLNAVVELSDSESDSDYDDSAFDTNFIDKVSAELPLAYVTESPEEETDLGPDPFDTGYAEKVIKGPEVSSRGKKLVNIGAAVEVLTGKVETAATSAKSRRQRRGIQNLLLESFEANLEDGEAPIAPEQVTTKTLLDEPAELEGDVPIDLSVSLHLTLLQQQKKEKEETDEGKDEHNVLDEFDVLKKDDEELEKPKQDKQAPPSRPPQPSNLQILLGQEESEEEDLGDDPFDTAYVEKIVPKSIDYDDDFDPRGAEDEEEEDFNPRVDDVDLFATPIVEKKKPPTRPPCPNLAVRKDLLSASHTDLASIAPTLEPNADVDSEPEIDPFDTSAVNALVAPGKTELKYLEKELLESYKKKDSLSDDDFDPRAEEEPKPDIDTLRQRKSSLSLQITAAAPKLVSVTFAVATPDLLRVDAEAGGKIPKPLTPYYNRSLSIEEAIEEDPFDTSFVPTIEPSSIELDLIEQEILKQPTITHSLSDPDFDPRAVTPVPQGDLLLAPDNHDIKVLTPARGSSSPEEIEVDPFDTSIAINILPGSTELKLLEDELIDKKPEAPQSNDIISDTQDNSIYSKILTPQPTGSVDLEEDFDPFDTSFASNLAPGETEIKLIESEFIN